VNSKILKEKLEVTGRFTKGCMDLDGAQKAMDALTLDVMTIAGADEALKFLPQDDKRVIVNLIREKLSDHIVAEQEELEGFSVNGSNGNGHTVAASPAIDPMTPGLDKPQLLPIPKKGKGRRH